MSKCNNSNKCSKSNKKCCNLESKLNEVGLTVEDVKNWIATGDIEETPEAYPDDQLLFSFLGIEQPKTKKSSGETFAEKNSKDYFGNSLSTGNVTFVPAQFAEDVEVYVDGIKMKNVTYVQLSYDPETNMPKLSLEIFNPLVSS